MPHRDPWEDRVITCTGKRGAPIRPKILPILCIPLIFLIAGCSSSKSIHYRIESDYTVADPQFTRTIGNLLGPSLVGGNRVQTLRNGDEIFPAMLDAIRSAKRTITFETYIYWSGEVAKQFADALSERAIAGVRVHVMLDWLGSGKIDKAYLREMKSAGCQVEEFHPFYFYDVNSFQQLDHRTHRKILVVDGRIGFTGGVGIADVWLGNADRPDHWRDNHYRIEGPAVAQLQAVFMDNWMQTTGEVLHGDDYFPVLDAAGPDFAQSFKSSAQGGSESMQLLFLFSIACAGKEVLMESPYFVPDELTIRALLAARRRGVKVEIIVPGPKIDEKIVRRASRASWGRLLKEGVKIYEYQPTMFHCKLLIVDGLWVSLGSSNMDNRSFRLNDEANLNVYDGEFARDQVQMFGDDRLHAKQITYEAWSQRPLRERVIEHLSKLFAWEL
jgi:cardiolipin synthase A/B